MKNINHWCSLTALYIFLSMGACFFCSAPGIAASKNVYQDSFIEHLEMGPATYLDIHAHGKNAADIDKKLNEIYHGNGLQPFWIIDGKPGPRAGDILAVLEDEKKLAEYRALTAQGGWTSTPAGKTLKPGMEDQRVKNVRQRLAITGELAPPNMNTAVFDAALADAVKQFQKRHNLNPDGVVGNQTLEAMNVPIASRIEQIILNRGSRFVVPRSRMQTKVEW